MITMMTMMEMTTITMGCHGDGMEEKRALKARPSPPKNVSKGWVIHLVRAEDRT